MTVQVRFSGNDRAYIDIRNIDPIQNFTFAVRGEYTVLPPGALYIMLATDAIREGFTHWVAEAAEVWNREAAEHRYYDAVLYGPNIANTLTSPTTVLTNWTQSTGAAIGPAPRPTLSTRGQNAASQSYREEIFESAAPDCGFKKWNESPAVKNIKRA